MYNFLIFVIALITVNIIVVCDLPYVTYKPDETCIKGTLRFDGVKFTTLMEKGTTKYNITEPLDTTRFP